MTGVLELFVNELPFVPDQLRDMFALQLFLELADGEHQPEYRDGVSHIRLLTATDSIQPESRGLLLVASWISISSSFKTRGIMHTLDEIDKINCQQKSQAPAPAPAPKLRSVVEIVI